MISISYLTILKYTKRSYTFLRPTSSISHIDFSFELVRLKCTQYYMLYVCNHVYVSCGNSLLVLAMNVALVVDIALNLQHSLTLPC